MSDIFQLCSLTDYIKQIRLSWCCKIETYTKPEETEVQCKTMQIEVCSFCTITYIDTVSSCHLLCVKAVLRLLPFDSDLGMSTLVDSRTSLTSFVPFVKHKASHAIAKYSVFLFTNYDSSLETKIQAVSSKK